MECLNDRNGILLTNFVWIFFSEIFFSMDQIELGIVAPQWHLNKIKKNSSHVRCSPFTFYYKS